MAAEDANERRETRNRWLTLIAMTLSSGMILVDQTSVPLAIPDAIDALGANVGDGQWVLTANMLPLAAFMVLGGRLGDLRGLRAVFIGGAVVFSAASAMAGAAQDMAWLIVARAVQGFGAAMMMPTAVAIVNATFPKEERGRALGLLAGLAAFAAALGPVIGGGLASIEWRLVFFVNVPLAIVTILIALNATPKLAPDPGAAKKLDIPGVLTFGLGIAALVYGVGQGQAIGWSDPGTLIPLIGSVLAMGAFVVVERLSPSPMIEFRLFRHLNFLAANISQVLAGMIELGLAYLLPYFLLLVIGMDPLVAGLALIPATIPIIIAGPWAGRAFDRVGGRMPLVAGFLVLAASGVALALAAPEQTYVYLVPGLILQGIGLGIVLTANDPTGLSSVPDEDQGQAAGIIDTTEQLGGALGIAGLTAVLLGYYRDKVFELLGEKGIHPTQAQTTEWREFIVQVQEKGFHQIDLASQDRVIRVAADDVIHAHALANEVVFFCTAGIALLGAVVCFALVRKEDRVESAGVFGRRSRWIWSTTGRTPGVTRKPPGA